MIMIFYSRFTSLSSFLNEIELIFNLKLKNTKEKIPQNILIFFCVLIERPRRELYNDFIKNYK